jgi:hypothetical protein
MREELEGRTSSSVIHRSPIVKADFVVRQDTECCRMHAPAEGARR